MRKITLLVLVAAPAFLLQCRQDEVRANSDPPPIEIRAVVQPAQSMSITAQIEGKVESIAVRQGATIAADAAIVKLTNASADRDAAVARAQLDWVETRLRRGGRPATSAPARPRDSLEITAKILELRQNRLEKMKQLRKTNDITARELEYSEIEYLAALRDYNNERRGFAVAPQASDDRDLLRIELQKLTAEERFAAQRQLLLRVNSPIAGTVTRIHVKPGQAVFPRDPIAEVSDVSTMHVQGDIAPELLRYVQPGMRVDVKILSVPPRTFADEIDYIVPVQAGSQSRVATVVVTIPNPDGSIQPNTEAVITLRSLR